MAASVATASLSAAERRALRRIVDLARRELGDRLASVWLYGSRARGERPHDESDVDVLIIADDERAERLLFPVNFAALAAEPEGLSPVFVDVRVRTPAWLAGRRAIESFFIQEVDRDKIVLYGDA